MKEDFRKILKQKHKIETDALFPKKGCKNMLRNDLHKNHVCYIVYDDDTSERNYVCILGAFSSYELARKCYQINTATYQDISIKAVHIDDPDTLLEPECSPLLNDLLNNTQVKP